MALTPAEVDGFRRDGYVSRIAALSPAEVALFRETAERFERDHPEDARWAFDIKANLLFPWVHENGRHPRILEAVADLLGPDLLLTDSIFRIKDPGSAVNYGWHQDAARITVEPCPVIVYVAFSPATAENGCLSVIPGTHQAVQPFDLVSNPGQPNRRVARVRDPAVERAVGLELEPGEIAIFSANVVHGSPANRSQARRFAVLHDYTPPSARQSIGQGSGQLVMGVDRFGHFAAEPAPGPDFEANATMRRRVLNRYPENILMGPLAPDEKPEFPDRPDARAA
ncbi:MAG: phytanoyl-CoA dioxygenase family protein [Alphaproteobacteria bacterium]|nr:phytanoyl-CoA dioxygenase family protein [Alphaproteobacteria bacterium]